MNLHKQNGFASIWLLLLLVPVGITVYMGWYVHQTNKLDQETHNAQQSQTVSYKGWKTYTDASTDFTLLYPPSWRHTDGFVSLRLFPLPQVSEAAFESESDDDTPVGVYVEAFAVPSSEASKDIASLMTITSTYLSSISAGTSQTVVRSRDVSVNNTTFHYEMTKGSSQLQVPNQEYAIVHNKGLLIEVVYEPTSKLEPTLWERSVSFSQMAKSIKFNYN